MPADADGEKIYWAEIQGIFQRVRKQLSILSIPKSNYALIDFTAQV
jgi:hypothetical protein